MKYLLGLIFLSYGHISAQNTINGIVKTDHNVPADFVNIYLMSLPDSAVIKSCFTDENGRYAMSDIKSQPMFVKAIGLGYKDYISSAFTPTQVESEVNITIETVDNILSEVTVTHNTAKIEQKIDRLVINVSTIQSAGNNAADLLEKSPGILVNRSSGSISMLGKSGVNIMINGKVNNTSSDAALQLLQGMDASQISKIELITTPPAGLDAQGNAGYINIILKENPDFGWNGNYLVMAGYGQGPVGMISPSIQYRKDKLALNASISSTLNSQDQYVFFEKNLDGTITHTDNDRLPKASQHNYRLGIHYDLSKNFNIGANVSGYNKYWDLDSRNNFTRDGSDTTVDIQIFEINNWYHQQYNLNLGYKLSKASSLSIDGDLLRFENVNNSTYDFAYAKDNVNLRNSLRSTDKSTPFDIKLIKADYVHKWEKSTLSLGAKLTKSIYENQVSVIIDNEKQNDLSSQGDFDEEIRAAYVDMNSQVSSKINLKAGLRYEHTISDLVEDTEKIVSINKGRLFPSLFADYKITTKSNINAQYSKRITRPAFSDISSFLLYIDPQVLFTGNAKLQFAISDVAQLGYTVKNVNLIAQYTYDKASIAGHQGYFDVESNIFLRRPANLEWKKTASLSVSTPYAFTSKWNSRWFASINHIAAKDVFGNVLQGPTFSINSGHTITLPYKLSLDVNGFYSHYAVDGNRKNDPVMRANMAIKKVLKNGANLTFAIDDVFDTFKFADVNYFNAGTRYVRGGIDFSPRTFKLSYGHTFGNQKMKKVNERQTSVEEKSRIN